MVGGSHVDQLAMEARCRGCLDGGEARHGENGNNLCSEQRRAPSNDRIAIIREITLGYDFWPKLAAEEVGGSVTGAH